MDLSKLEWRKSRVGTRMGIFLAWLISEKNPLTVRRTSIYPNSFDLEQRVRRCLLEWSENGHNCWFPRK